MVEILIIDDDPVTQRVLKRALEGQGYSVAALGDPQAGLKAARQSPPALILCDWMLQNEISGLDLCQQVKSDPRLSTTLFILLTSRGSTADRILGLDAGADDLLSKPVDISELKARVRAGLRLQQLTRDLQLQKQRLEAELAEAAAYVRSLLPPPMTGKVPIDSRFIPSRQLGGDCFDYYWLDPDYLAIYLLDVSGHGLGSALLSTSVLNVLRSQSLPGINFYRPESVLRGLNETFQMNDQHEKYFTIWYGVYNRARRQIAYASAGHPPAVLISLPPGSPLKVDQLRTPGMPIGMMSDATYIWKRCDVAPNSRMYVFSDGIYEVQQANREMVGLDSFVDLLSEGQGARTLDDVLSQVEALRVGDSFSDDLSILEVNFG